MPDNMIALFVAPADRAKLLNILPESLRQYAQPEESLHLTLSYWSGDAPDPEYLRAFVARLAQVETMFLPFKGKIQGWGVFEQGDKRVLYASFDHVALPGLHREVMMNFPSDLSNTAHGFTPHITLAYLPAGTAIPDFTLEPFDLTFDRLYLATDATVVSNGPVEGVQEIGKDAPLETHFELAKSVTDLPNGDLEIIVKGVPFGGPAYLNGKDITQEYFDKNTDIGNLPVVLSYFHHGKDPLFGKELLGKAEYLEMSPEEGHFYKIIVDKAAKYRNAIKALAKHGWLGASSTPFQRTAEKSADGHWDRWHVVEVCLTYSPAHPEADVLSVIEKSIGDTMDPIKNSAPGENDTPVTDPLTPAAVPNTPVVDVVAEVEKALSEGEEQAPNFEAVLEKAFAAFEARMEVKIQEALAPLGKDIGNINIALPLIAKKIGQSVKTELQSDLQKSAPERIAEQIVRRTSGNPASSFDPSLPADAPGNE